MNAMNHTRRQRLLIQDSALKNGTHIVASPGAGKSRLIGRQVAFQQFLREIPQVALDPVGGIIDNFLDKMRLLPDHIRRQSWRRVVYIDVGATDYIVPTPLYYRFDPNETTFTVANRFPGLIRRIDPELTSAPILGWNSLSECAIYAGQIASALNRQIDFVADLIERPRAFKDELNQALALYPELQPAIKYFRDLMDPNSGELRNRRTGSFSNKLIPFASDPTMLASFAASQPGIDWEQVVREKMTVLIDFRHELDAERRRFKMLYWFRYFIDFIKHRGMRGRGNEVGFIVDEVTQLLGQRLANGKSIMSDDLEELVTVIARGMALLLVIAHQNLSQVDETICNILMQLGTQIIGNISNPDDALYLARQLVHYAPYMIKKEEPVWMGLSMQSLLGNYTQPTIIDYTTKEFSLEEQQAIAATKFQQLAKFQFLVRPALSEGDMTGKLQRISIKNLDKGQYPDANEIATLRQYLRQKWGVPIDVILSEIYQRKNADHRTLELPKPRSELQMKSTPQLAILKGEDKNTYAVPGNIVSTTNTDLSPNKSSRSDATVESTTTDDDPYWR